ncbi:MAG: YdcF family protein [Ghiorsea sp.]
MLLLSKSIAQILLPPGGLILLALAGLIFWQRVWGRLLVGLALLLFWALSTEPVRNTLTSGLEHQYPPYNFAQAIKSNTAIVLLGGGLEENSPDNEGHANLSRAALKRTVFAARVAEHNNFPIYITGGAPLSQVTETEAKTMADWLIWFGVDSHRIHTENQANTTWENAVYTQKLLVKSHINTVILVTSAWHMPRAVSSFKKQGLEVIAAPTDYLTEFEPYDMRSYIPHWDVFAESGDALHEYLGLVWYQFK